MLSTSKYSIALEFNLVDQCRYKYVSTEWFAVRNADEECEDRLSYVHPNSPAAGKYWKNGNISFTMLRVTNDRDHKKDSVSILLSVKKLLHVEMKYDNLELSIRKLKTI